MANVRMSDDTDSDSSLDEYAQVYEKADGHNVNKPLCAAMDSSYLVVDVDSTLTDNQSLDSINEELVDLNTINMTNVQNETRTGVMTNDNQNMKTNAMPLSEREVITGNPLPAWNGQKQETLDQKYELRIVSHLMQTNDVEMLPVYEKIETSNLNNDQTHRTEIHVNLESHVNNDQKRKVIDQDKSNEDEINSKTKKSSAHQVPQNDEHIQVDKAKDASKLNENRRLSDHPVPQNGEHVQSDQMKMADKRLKEHDYEAKTPDQTKIPTTHQAAQSFQLRKTDSTLTQNDDQSKKPGNNRNSPSYQAPYQSDKHADDYTPKRHDDQAKIETNQSNPLFKANEIQTHRNREPVLRDIPIEIKNPTSSLPETVSSDFDHKSSETSKNIAYSIRFHIFVPDDFEFETDIYKVRIQYSFKRDWDQEKSNYLDLERIK
jgi:hypothetical protein